MLPDTVKELAQGIDRVEADLRSMESRLYRMRHRLCQASGMRVIGFVESPTPPSPLADLENVLKAYRAEHAEHNDCVSFEQTGSDNTDVEVIDRRCDLCRRADLALAIMQEQS